MATWKIIQILWFCITQWTLYYHILVVFASLYWPMSHYFITVVKSAVLDLTSLPLITPPFFFGMSKNFSKVSKGKSKTDNFPPLFFGKIGSKGGGKLSLIPLMSKNHFCRVWEGQKSLMTQKIDFFKVRDIDTPIQPRKKKHQTNVSSALKTF